VARLEAGLRDFMREWKPITRELRGLKAEKSTQTEARPKRTAD
jgi:hypothetical protein